MRRNLSRFPSDFMIELTREEYDFLRCQNGTIESGRGEHSKYLPFAFTENGVARSKHWWQTPRKLNQTRLASMQTDIKIDTNEK